jgi:Taurine catabolism dioxygenase TauD, TfdA family
MHDHGPGEPLSAVDAELPPPQRGPWVWSAEDAYPEEELDEDAVAELAAAAAPYVVRGEEGLGDLARGTAAGFPLPTLGPRLVALRTSLLTGRGFAVLRGLPVHRYGIAEAAATFLGLGVHLGRARPQNAAGDLLGHVCDLGRTSADPSTRIYQTHERQTFHTDSCDLVGLLCLREAWSGGDSLLVSAGAIYNEMRRSTPALLARLLRPMAHDRRGEVPVGADPFFLLPVFSWFSGLLSVFYQRQYIDSAQRFDDAPRLTAEDVAALDRFDALADDPSLHVCMRLAPGDMQLVHNHALLHDRTAFKDGPDPGRGRHLLRLWLACPGARPLPPAFAARYGTVTIGDRGGVVVPGAHPRVSLHPR